MSIDYSKILIRKFAGQEWTLNGDEYSGLTWLSDTPKPTKAKLDGLWNEVKNEIDAELAAKIIQRQAILDRLGLTADEAKLILG
jgi:hypothetical protein